MKRTREMLRSHFFDHFYRKNHEYYPWNEEIWITRPFFVTFRPPGTLFSHFLEKNTDFSHSGSKRVPKPWKSVILRHKFSNRRNLFRNSPFWRFFWSPTAEILDFSKGSNYSGDGAWQNRVWKVTFKSTPILAVFFPSFRPFLRTPISEMYIL